MIRFLALIWTPQLISQKETIIAFDDLGKKIVTKHLLHRRWQSWFKSVFHFSIKQSRNRDLWTTFCKLHDGSVNKIKFLMLWPLCNICESKRCQQSASSFCSILDISNQISSFSLFHLFLFPMSFPVIVRYFPCNIQFFFLSLFFATVLLLSCKNNSS